MIIDTTAQDKETMATSVVWKINPEETPNPQTIRFKIEGAKEPFSAGKDFQTSEEAQAGSPLAAKLFGFPWTMSVFIGPDFLTLTKADWVDWSMLKDPLCGLIKEHMESGEPLLFENPNRSDGADDSTNSSLQITDQDTKDVALIKKTLSDDIRPMLLTDGGDIHFHKYEDGVVYVYLRGSCSGCPSSSQTLKLGIETRLRQVLPDIMAVVAL